jgi:glycerol-3-phosphate dehydrogenase (NAD(P)+)
MWSYEESVTAQIREERENRDYLPGVKLPPTVEVSMDHGEALDGAEMVIAVVPSHAFRGVIAAAAPHVPGDAIVLSATKGIEVATLERPSEILEELLPEHARPAVLSGPTFAREVGEGDPNTDRFRVYTNEDILGVELAGALKNVIALGAGIAAGLGYRSNSRAALITRGLAEMTRLGLAVGAQAATFAGLAGLGDLVLTCSSELSRSHMQFGAEPKSNGRSAPRQGRDVGGDPRQHEDGGRGR